MHLLSYRGPGVAGGVSSGLSQVWQLTRNSDSSAALASQKEDSYWWFLDGASVCRHSAKLPTHTPMNVFDPRLVAGHYRYCNEFIWPLMHDMPQFARYYPADRELYQRFNAAFAQIVCSSGDRLNAVNFVQDYQLAMLPLFLKLEAGRRSTVFWHIPWPRSVPREYVEPITAIARALLSAEHVGFHTQEYASNFLRFVSENLPGYGVDAHNGFVVIGQHRSAVSTAIEAQYGKLHFQNSASYVTRPLRRLKPLAPCAGTSVSSHPLAIQSDQWRMQSAASTGATVERLGINTKFVLSVDRVDYTKGVRERFRAIDQFFAKFPHWQENLTFVEVCGRSRLGVRAFDDYFDECRKLYAQVNARWSTNSWAPIRWIEQKLGTQELADLYKHADVMLISALRDGLNLTAKEFVACSSQTAEPGVLLLSDQTGVWHEFCEGATRLSMNRADQIPERIDEAMRMPLNQRRQKIDAMYEKLLERSLYDWWSVHAGCAASAPNPAASDTIIGKTKVG